jgi:hypothetical protein
MTPFSPSTHDLSTIRLQSLAEIPLAAPTPISARRAAPIILQPVRQPMRKGKNGVHYFTAATPPIETSVLSTSAPSARSRRMAAAAAASAAAAADYSPPVSPHLHNYAPSFPGRSHPGSPYVPPGSVPSSPIHASDPQNLIPSSVRGAGYNPFQHTRSTSELVEE